MNLEFSKAYVLENEWVRLEPLVPHHFSALKYIAEEPNLWTFFLSSSSGQENFKAYFDNILQKRAEGLEYTFAVYNKAQQAYAGSTRFLDYNIETNSIRLGHTWLGETHRGTGLNLHMKYLLFEFAFECLGVERIGMGVHAQNVRSVTALKKVGCVMEGEIRNLFPSIEGNTRVNAILFGILKSEWEISIKTSLKGQL